MPDSKMIKTVDEHWAYAPRWRDTNGHRPRRAMGWNGLTSSLWQHI
jgi:hypothetical protein